MKSRSLATRRSAFAAMTPLLCLGLSTGLALALIGCSSSDTITPSLTGTPDSGPDQGTPDSRPDAPAPDALPPTPLPEAGPDVMAAPPQCAAPVFAPAAGTIASGATVSISSANLPSNGFIFFTTNDTLPTHS